MGNARYEKYKESYRRYREKNKEKIREIKRKYLQNNKDKVKAYLKKNRDKYLEHRKRNNNKRRRKLGFVPLNKPFENAEAHHINEEDVIYISKDIHRSVSHNLHTGKNMEEINKIAMQCLVQE